MGAAFRSLRCKVSSQQLLIFRLATINEMALTEVAKKLAVSLPQVYLARHRVGKLFKAEVQRLRAESVDEPKPPGSDLLYFDPCASR